jgi:hypothetical protein
MNICSFPHSFVGLYSQRFAPFGCFSDEFRTVICAKAIGVGLTAPHRKNHFVKKCHKDLGLRTDSLERVLSAKYNQNDKSRRIRWAGHVTLIELTRKAYRVLVGKPEGKRPLGRPRRRWEDLR